MLSPEPTGGLNLLECLEPFIATTNITSAGRVVQKNLGLFQADRDCLQPRQAVALAELDVNLTRPEMAPDFTQRGPAAFGIPSRPPCSTRIRASERQPQCSCQPPPSRHRSSSDSSNSRALGGATGAALAISVLASGWLSRHRNLRSPCASWVDLSNTWAKCARRLASWPTTPPAFQPS